VSIFEILKQILKIPIQELSISQHRAIPLGKTGLHWGDLQEFYQDINANCLPPRLNEGMAPMEDSIQKGRRPFRMGGIAFRPE